MLEPAKALLDRGSGLQAHAYQITRAQGFAIVSRHVETEGTPAGFSQAMLDTESRMPTAFVPTIFCSAPAIVTMTQMSDTVPLLDHPEYRPHETMSEYGLKDMLAVVAHDPSGIAVVLCAPSERPLQRVEDRELEGWCMLRAHLLAGLRLQHVLGGPSDPDAVIDASGRIVHAERAARGRRARDALRQRALEIDRTRSAAGRRDPARALATWTGLIDGTWSLVDAFDSDGRRYFVARRNDPRLTGPRPLSERERQVLAFAALGYSNKQIAYTLGLAPSTISSHLQSAMHRVGARDIASVAAIFRGAEEAS